MINDISKNYQTIGQKEIINRINDFILKNLIRENGTYRQPVLGISGGKDSTVVAKLLINALKPYNIKPVFVSMPYELNKPEKYLNVVITEVIRNDGIVMTIPIRNIYDSFINSAVIEPTNQAEINLKPRIRMSILYMISQSIGGRVVGTGNKSEIIMGYSTKFGDTAYDFNPIGDLYKDEVIDIGKYLGIPNYILEVPPSDGISGLTDEENMGVTYSDIFEFGEYNEDFGCNIPKETFEKIQNQYINTRHKYSKPNILYLNGNI